MPKNIVILLDGTSNTISTKRTNVLRLYGCLKKSDQQLVYYDPGVGTIGPQGSWSRLWRNVVEVWGMATGYGIDRNVKQAYQFIVENYEGRGKPDAERDRIYILGFSRGAYTARMLAGFIYCVGLIEKRNLNLLEYAYRAYKRIGEKRDEEAFSEVRLYERILETDRPPIKFLGLFDTVASVIEPGPNHIPQLKRHAYTSRNAGVEVARHAVGLQEYRRMYRAVPWPEDQTYTGRPFGKPEKPQDAKEVWFSGCHGDIGGGYPEAEGGLAKIPLIWMIDESKPHCLEFETRTVNRLVHAKHKDTDYVPPDACGRIHDSMGDAWKLLEYIPLPVKEDGKTVWRRTKCEPRNVLEGAKIHASVIARSVKHDLPEHIPANHEIEGDPKKWTCT